MRPRSLLFSSPLSLAALAFATAASAAGASQGPTADPLVATGACIAESAANGFQMPDTSKPDVTVINVPSDGIENYIPYAPSDENLPSTIQGIWWMQGNPFGLLTDLSNATYDPETRTATHRMYDSGSYSFYALPWEDCSYKGILKAKVRFEIKFNETYTFASLVNITTGPDGKDIRNTDEIYTMELIEDGHWVRRSWANGMRIADYQLRRIVRADGTREHPAYDEYLSIATATSAIGKPKAPQVVKP